MAAAASLRSAQKVFIENHLQCSICQEKYTQPKVLDCQHSFCMSCLEMYHESRFKGADRIPCPFCRQEILLPQSGVPGLKTNFHLVGLIEEFSLQEELTTSEDTENTCDKEGPWEHLLKTTAVEVLSNQNNTFCSKHSENINTFYCETCEELICQACLLDCHSKPKHSVIDSAVAVSKQKQSLIQKMTLVEREVDDLSKIMSDMGEAKQRLSEKVSEAVGGVGDRASRLRSRIKAEEMRIIDEITAVELGLAEALTENEGRVGIILEEKQQLVKIYNDVAANASGDDFLSLYPAIRKDLDKSSSIESLVLQGKHSFPKWVDSRSFDDSDIDLGKVVQEDAWEMCLELGRQGSGLGEFGEARGVACACSGEFAVSDWTNRRVVIYNSNGDVKYTIPQAAKDVAVSQNRWVIVLPTLVEVYDSKGAFVFKFKTLPPSLASKRVVNLQSVAVKKDNNILVGDVKRNVLSEHGCNDGALLRTVPVEIPPAFLSVDDSRIFLSGWNEPQVVICDIDNPRQVLLIIKPIIAVLPVAFCSGVCADGSSIYIAMSGGSLGTGHIHRYDMSGDYVSCVAHGLLAPQGMTFTAGGRRLAVVDVHSVKIFRKV